MSQNEGSFASVLNSGGNKRRDKYVGVIGEGRPGSVFKPLDRGK